MVEAFKKGPERREGGRAKDLLVAEQLGLRMLGGIPNLLRISQTDFKNAQPAQIEEAWGIMQGPFHALMDYYEHFTEMQPLHIQGVQTSWREVQPYGSIQGFLSDKAYTMERLYKRDWADYWRGTFNEEAQKLLHIIALDFKLPESILTSEMSLEERVQILSDKTGPDLFGIRFLPVYRKLFTIRDKQYYKDTQKPAEAKVAWDPDDVLNRVTFMRGDRSYYVGSTGSPRNLEDLLDDEVLITGVERRSKSRKGKKTPKSVPVLDVDYTLTDGYHNYAFTPQAQNLFSFLDENGVSYIIWSRADKERIQWVLNEIGANNHTIPQLSCYFDRKTWPFQTIIRIGGDYFEHTPHTAESITRQINESILRFGLDLKKNGFENISDLVDLVLGYIAATKQKGASVEYTLQGKCPWLIPLSDVGVPLAPKVARALFNNGVLFDDRGTSLNTAQHLGFNFVHVPTHQSLENAHKFIS